VNGACAVGAYYIRLRTEAWALPAHRNAPIC
jgi:hypothetical protein